MQELNYRINLYEPLASGRDETGQRTRPQYRKHEVHARITSAVSGQGESFNLITSSDVRLYVIRWRTDISTRWILEDADNNWFQVEGLAPTLGGRRRGHLIISCRAITNPDLELENG